jgi:hypothetical protein
MMRALVLDMMLLLAPMMSSVGPKLGYLFPNPTWKVMVKLATYIALIISKEIEMLQKKKLKISDKRYEN